MKVLFLYKDPEYAHPLRRARERLAKLGITLMDFHCRNQAMTNQKLSEHPNVDLYLVHQHFLDCVVNLGKPVISHEKIDGAQIAGSRRHIDHPNVVGVFKSYTLIPSSLNNVHTGRYHVYMTNASTQSLPTVPVKHLEKIKTFYGFGAYRHMQMYLTDSVKLNGGRPLDVFFAGTVKYGDKGVERHRQQLVLELDKYGGPKKVIRGRVLNGREYRSLMLQSKVVVSPWGYGEFCHRDYEALAFGCMLVKPASYHVQSWPSVDYVPCAHNFCNVCQVVKACVDNYTYLQYARGLAKRCYSANNIAQKFVELLHECGL